MPYKPKRPCNKPGCTALGHDRFCERHKQDDERQYRTLRRADPAQRERDNFYSRAPWKRLRRAHLNQHPLCAECERAGRVIAADMVDHIVPIRQGGGALDPENLQSLCNPCHSRKSAQEGSRWG